MDFAARLATKLRASRTEVVRRWLDRIIARVSIEPNSVFPTDELLDHIPILVDGIADYLDGTTLVLDGDFAVSAKAMELGALRHSQGFDAYEIMKEHELLAGVLYAFFRDALAEMGPAEPADVAYSWQRIAEVTERIRQATMMHFLRISAEQVRLREERLRRFNRLVSHELKNRIGAIRGASTLLAEPWIDADQSGQFQRIIARNAEGLQRVVENLIALSALEGDARHQRNVLLPQAAAEVVRQLRDAAELSDVTVTIDPELPAVEVDAAAVELCLTNYVSNAIKYSDRAAPERWVRISGELVVGTASRPGELQVWVQDNGLGVVEGAREAVRTVLSGRSARRGRHRGHGAGTEHRRRDSDVPRRQGLVRFSGRRGKSLRVRPPSRREEDAAAAGTRRDVKDAPPEIGPAAS